MYSKEERPGGGEWTEEGAGEGGRGGEREQERGGEGAGEGGRGSRREGVGEGAGGGGMEAGRGKMEAEEMGERERAGKRDLCHH